jgi:SAM-dependent methyltransferase
MKIPILSSLLKKFYIYCSRKKLFGEYLSQSDTLPNERSVEYQFVFESIAGICPGRILDVGTGITSLPSLMRTCGFHVTAMDNIVDYWKTDFFNKHYHIISDDIRNPKITGKFDLITCVSVLEHIEDFDRAVSGICSLLNEGGYLVMTFPYNENAYSENVYDLPDSNASGKGIGFKTQAFSRNIINRWLTNFDIRIIKQTYWQFFTGKYWTVGERISPPREVTPSELHQISCLLLRKN